MVCTSEGPVVCHYNQLHPHATVRAAGPLPLPPSPPPSVPDPVSRGILTAGPDPPSSRMSLPLASPLGSGAPKYAADISRNASLPPALTLPGVPVPSGPPPLVALASLPECPASSPSDQFCRDEILPVPLSPVLPYSSSWRGLRCLHAQYLHSYSPVPTQSLFRLPPSSPVAPIEEAVDVRQTPQHGTRVGPFPKEGMGDIILCVTTGFVLQLRPPAHYT
ncbi:proline-rich protein 36-like [Schistocerca cancellata]|uniref:proline-rich protein 36-like n=1 Tax=Schistocerca cancellata TaxID=274614 RepID=UPI0021184673|nr:proline-rich protein 36-like [Schistocerca cancellata]